MQVQRGKRVSCNAVRREHVLGPTQDNAWDCTVLCPDTLPESLGFLPGFEKLSQEIDTSQDFVVTLDCKHGVRSKSSGTR